MVRQAPPKRAKLSPKFGEDEYSDTEFDGNGPLPQEDLATQNLDDDRENEENDELNQAQQAQLDELAKDMADQVMKMRKRDEKGFQTGSIVKVTMKDFVTYSHAVFNLGPGLNMITGPNGSGKSTLICALALALGGSPATIGRAQNVMDYVKNGCDQAVIEVELARPGGKENIRIRRIMDKVNNKNVWKINGVPTTATKAKQAVDSLGIDVDNLCTFLPQDKVAALANLNSTQLLYETEKAAGSMELHAQHQELIQLRNQQKSCQSRVTEIAQRVERNQGLNAILKQEVDNYNMLEQNRIKLKALEARKRMVEYNEAAARSRAKSDEVKEKKARLRQLQARDQPMLTRQSELKEQFKRLNDSRKKADDGFKTTNRKVHSKFSAFTQIESEAEELHAKLRKLPDREKQLKREIANLQSEINELREVLANKPADVDPQAEQQIRSQLTQLQKDLTPLFTNRDNINDDIRQSQQQADRIRNEMSRKSRDIENLQNVQKQREQHVFKFSDPARVTFEFIQRLKNEGRLKGEILMPLALSMSVKAEFARYKDHINSIIEQICNPYSMATTFVCLCEEDYEFIATQLLDNKHLRINLLHKDARWFDERREENLDAKRAEARQLGFDFLLVDAMECDDRWKDLLMYDDANFFNVKPQTVPVAMNEISQRSRKYIEDEGVFGNSNGRYVVGRQIHQMRTSKYDDQMNRKKVMTRSQFLQPCKVLKIQVDTSRVDAIKEEITHLRIEVNEREQEVQGYVNRLNKISQEIEKLEAQKLELRNRQKSLQESARKFAQAQAQYGTKRNSLTQKKERLQSLEKEKEQLKITIRDSSGKRGVAALAALPLARQLFEGLVDRNSKYLSLLDTKMELDVNERECSQVRNDCLEAEREFEAAMQESKRLKDAAMEIFEVASVMYRNADDAVKEKFQEINEDPVTKEWGLDRIDEEINSVEATIQLTRATDATVVDQYRERERVIAHDQKEYDIESRNLSTVTNRLEKVKNNWHPKLTALIRNVSTNFSNYFEKINCIGEVQLAEHDDFDKFELKILVKFRDNEDLQVLNAHRQSGGERAVTTMLFLLSLQEMSKAPFRVVDEINQGMDQRNERLIHKLLVEVSSQPNSPQYFLVTPKLLPNLYYDQKMKVHCVYNGPEVDEDLILEKFNTKDHILKLRQRKAIGVM